MRILGRTIDEVTEGVEDTTKEGGADGDIGKWLVCLTVSLSLIRQLLPKTDILTLWVSKLRHMPREFHHLCKPEEQMSVSSVY